MTRKKVSIGRGGGENGRISEVKVKRTAGNGSIRVIKQRRATRLVSHYRYLRVRFAIFLSQ